jgi:hypothetical protein
VAPPHSLLAVHPRQLWVPGSHTGVPPPHCALDTQATQVPEATAQAGVAPVQRAAFVAEQAPQAPVGWHAGVAPPQSASLAQPRQIVAGTSQTGVVPVQRVAFVAEQTLHTPLGTHAGEPPWQSLSSTQPRQSCVVLSQMGVGSQQLALVTHRTHVPVAT